MQVTTDRTLIAVTGMLEALPSPFYDVGVQTGSAMLSDHSGISADKVVALLGFLKGRNLRGANIYIRPAGTIRYTLLDDLTREALQAMERDGFQPCCTVETSPGNFQAWLRYPCELTRETATLASQTLTRKFGADPSAAGWRRFGRLAGFTNRKPKHRRENGLFPFVLLRQARSNVFTEANGFLKGLCEELERRQAQPATLSIPCPGTLSPQRGRRFSHLSLQRFRDLPKYHGQPARADLAFALAALANGMPESEVSKALSVLYISRDRDEKRQNLYVIRTLLKARARAQSSGAQSSGGKQ